MLKWFGIGTESKVATPFFGAMTRKGRVLLMVLATVLAAGVIFGLSSLLTAEQRADSLVAVLPGTIGVLLGLLVMFVGERLSWDKVKTAP